MRIMRIEPITFNGGVKILAAENKENKYLYNHILKMTKDFKIPATFHTNEIELPSVSKAILDKLNELGIKFSSK